MDQVGRQVLISLIECILQSRISVQKKQIQKFNQTSKQLSIKTSQTQQFNLSTFLQSLLIIHKYGLRQRITSQNGYESITIYFKLVNNSTGQSTQSQVWLIEFDQLCHFDKQNQQKDFKMITTLFEELLLFLNKQPLFSEYQRNATLKKSFTISYQMILKSQKQTNAHSKLNTILDLPLKYNKFRICQCFIIKIQCYYLPKFDNLLENLDIAGGMGKQERTSTIDTSKNAHKVQPEDEKTRKSSFYEFYDKQLDFVFLSSDDQTFKKSGGNEIKSVDIDIGESQQFQLLIVSKDDEFIDDNQHVFQQFDTSLYANTN